MLQILESDRKGRMELNDGGDKWGPREEWGYNEGFSLALEKVEDRQVSVGLV